jgi:hypothetical protein
MLQPSPKHYDDHTPSGIHIQVQNLWDYLRLLGWNGLSPTMRLLCIRMMRCIGLSWGNVPGLSYVAWYNLILCEFMFFFESCTQLKNNNWVWLKMRYTRKNWIFNRENDDETREFGVLHFQTNPFFVGYLRLAKCIVYVPASKTWQGESNSDHNDFLTVVTIPSGDRQILQQRAKTTNSMAYMYVCMYIYMEVS